jgi:hypothetical protein
VKARIEEVVDGRESVKKGVIQGVDDNDTPQRVMTTRLLHLPSWNPESYWIFLLRRAVFPFSPEPELYFPPGTDLRLKLAAPLELPVNFRVLAADENSSEEEKIDPGLREKLLALPTRSVTGSGKVSDVVNLAFLGSAEQIEKAFESAGWTYGDSVSTWSVLREMRAMSSLNSYSHLPISRQWLDGEAPDFLFQKSFNSYEKREHIRIWNEDALADGLWASGAIRETSAVWSFRRFKFIHHVDADLAAERDKVVRELTMTGCVAHVQYVERPEGGELVRNASGDTLRSDGDLALVQMKDCEAPVLAIRRGSNTLAARPKSRLKRFIRAQALSIRDLWQSNLIYASFDLSRTVIRSLRNRHDDRQDVAPDATATASLGKTGSDENTPETEEATGASPAGN